MISQLDCSHSFLSLELWQHRGSPLRLDELLHGVHLDSSVSFSSLFSHINYRCLQTTLTRMALCHCNVMKQTHWKSIILNKFVCFVIWCVTSPLNWQMAMEQSDNRCSIIIEICGGCAIQNVSYFKIESARFWSGKRHALWNVPLPRYAIIIKHPIDFPQLPNHYYLPHQTDTTLEHPSAIKSSAAVFFYTVTISKVVPKWKVKILVAWVWV